MFFRLLLFFLFSVSFFSSPSFSQTQGPQFETKLYLSADTKKTAPVYELPIKERTNVTFMVFDYMRGEFDPADKIEIWRVDDAGKQQEKLGMAVPPVPHITTGEPIPRVLTIPLARDTPGIEHYQAFTTHKYGERMVLPPVPVKFLETPAPDPEFERKLSACMKKKEDLANQVPPKTVTSNECAEAGGHIETPALFCPEDPEDGPASDSVCKKGLPLGSVRDVHCPCICCK